MRKTALITGASSEVGSSISKVLASNNINIIIHYNTNYENASKLQKEIEENYDIETLLVEADLSKEEEINKLVEESLNKFDKIDILINNAALDKPNLFNEKTSEEFKEILDVNLIAPFLLSKKIGTLMVKNNYGKIINIASTNGIDTYYPMCLDYDASKAALISLTHNLALEFKPVVNVNAIAPGWVETKKDMEDLSEEYIESEKEKVFKNRFGTPLEIAYLVEFLISEKAEYINNQVIRIDGGLY
ncbi:MAG: SDR family oxidoreductase [Lactobacillales bacterium]|nr:SDR family oxidoreductase [Lactobacillales bacterium]